MNRRQPLLLVALLAGACSTTGETNSIQQQVAIQNFPTCGQLEQHIKNAAVAEMNHRLDSYLRDEWSWGFLASDATAEGRQNSPSTDSGPAAYTKTNVQVEGVNESDFMKNDGTRIFVLAGQNLVATKSWPAKDLALGGQLAIEGWPTSMFLDEKSRVVVLSRVWTKWAPEDPDQSCYDGFWCGYSYANSTKITVVDASDIKSLKVLDEFYLPGNYTNSRRVGPSVRVVLNDYFRWPQGVVWWPNVPNWDDKAAKQTEVDRLKVANEKLIRAQPIDKWMPRSMRKLADGRMVPLDYNCSDFFVTNTPTHLGLMTVATLNLDKPDAAPTRTSILAEWGEVYATPTSLYLASRHWWWWSEPGQMDWTYLYKFDISDPSVARFVAAGGVEGYILDQFAMDEWQDHLRVATTITTRSPDFFSNGRTDTTNRVSVLETKGQRIQVVGRSEDLAQGERIQSARFIGAKGFVVTFRQVDPLYTFDLSNPHNPRKIGELKVPGFSTYIHPIDDTTLLTIGIHVPESGNGDRAMKLSMFDVSDFANPKEKFTQLVGNGRGWSEAVWDHHAFNYFPERKLLAVPFSDWYSGGGSDDYWGWFVSDIRLFGIDKDSGIAARGALTMRDLYMANGYESWTWYYSPWIRRSVMASDQAGNEFVYAVADSGIRVADSKSLNVPLATVTFPIPQGQPGR